MGASMKPEMEKLLSNLQIQLQSGLVGLISMVVLTERPMHGYELMQQVNCVTGGAISVKEATLYPTLRRMERMGFVSSEWQRSSRGPRKRIYHITRFGDEYLEEALLRYEEILKKVGKMIRNHYRGRGPKR